MKLVCQPAACVEVQISLLMQPHTHTARLLLLGGVWVRKRECVCEWNGRHERSLELPLSALSLKPSTLHAFYLFLPSRPLPPPHCVPTTIISPIPLCLFMPLLPSLSGPSSSSLYQLLHLCVSVWQGSRSCILLHGEIRKKKEEEE